MCNKLFNFNDEVEKYYKITPIKTTIKDICNQASNGRGSPTPATRKIGVYALYENNILVKIGKATYTTGIYHRMSQYYNMNRTGGLRQITESNRDKIVVKYFNLDSIEQCWVAERRLQVIAYDCGEKMPWEEKSRN